MQLPFHIVDVFAESKYSGNQLAVFEHAQDLTLAQMQNIAREINFAESTFITQIDKRSNSATIRIFTPEFEMKFAGHPIIGSAWVIMNTIFGNPSQAINLTVPIGEIPVFHQDNRVWLQSAQPNFFDVFQVSDLYKISNLYPSDFNFDYPIQEVSTGSAFVIVPLSSKEALSRLKLDLVKTHEWLQSNCKTTFQALYFFYLDGIDLFSRMLYVEHGQLKEDAATGSASTCLQAFLLRYHSSNIQIVNQQGDFIGRPSKIYFNGKRNGEDFDIKIGGASQYIARGEWQV
jgi:trans-2,3-dihydro-3-hydroxyanthranilate isomerase